MSDQNDEFPDHANEDPDDNEFVERVSDPDDFVEPLEGDD